MDNSIEVLFDKDSIELGDVKITSVHKATLSVNDSSKIDYWEVSCGCTKVTMSGNTINVEFNVGHSIGQPLSPGQSSTKYRYIDFFLNPGEPEYVADAVTKKKLRNEKKKSIRIPINYIAHG